MSRVDKKGQTIAVVGARLNSSRLPGKHLLDLAGKPLIIRLFERIKSIPEVDEIILATTADEENQPLLDLANKYKIQCYSYNGDVNDLVGRVNAIAREVEPEYIIYICGDSPLIEPATISLMIRTLKHNPDADYVSLQAPNPDRQLIHEGFFVYRYSLWLKMVGLSKTPREREHVGLALEKLSGSLNPVIVMENEIYGKIKHRISVDTPSDYQFMSQVYQHWYEKNPDETIVSLPWVIETLLSDGQLRAINSHVKQRGASQVASNVLIVACADSGAEEMTLHEVIYLTKVLQDYGTAGVHIIYQGTAPPGVRVQDLQVLHILFTDEVGLCDAVAEFITEHSIDVAILHSKASSSVQQFEELYDHIRKNNCRVIQTSTTGSKLKNMKIIDITQDPAALTTEILENNKYK